jgi:D-beta-D-heptose 7-phosphate kinase / D-beta-D-heptose 1-phosphate adenosyltransferase
MSGPVVVVGDAVLDVDAVGNATRLCPDAPAPVLEDVAEHARPGGAGLAAIMAAADGKPTVLVTSCGDDEAGERLLGLLNERGVDVVRVPYDGPTTVKYRVRAGGQSLLRMDSGGHGRHGDPPTAVADYAREAESVLVSDYGLGLAGLPGIAAAIRDRPRTTPLVWDPHPRGPHPIPGIDVLTPNAAEARLLARRIDKAGEAEPAANVLAHASRDAAILVAGLGPRAVAVTLGATGALLSYGTEAPFLATPPTGAHGDSCGAGDRFAVSVATGLGVGLLPTEAVHRAVTAAAWYIAAGGPESLRTPDGPGSRRDPWTSARSAADRVHASGGVVVATGGCFDLLHAGHIETLRAARGLGDCLVVCLNSDASVRRLKGPARPLVSAVDRARVLRALEFVDDVVVFDEDTPAEALTGIRPDIWVKGGDYADASVPESATLARWGGQTVLLPYLEGRSTTSLVEAAAAGLQPTSVPSQGGAT